MVRPWSRSRRLDWLEQATDLTEDLGLETKRYKLTEDLGISVVV